VEHLPQRDALRIAGHDQDRGAERGERLEAKRGGLAQQQEHAGEPLAAVVAANREVGLRAEIVQRAPVLVEAPQGRARFLGDRRGRRRRGGGGAAAQHAGQDQRGEAATSARPWAGAPLARTWFSRVSLILLRTWAAVGPSGSTLSDFSHASIASLMKLFLR